MIIKRLREEVEQVAGRRLLTTTDFDFLSRQIFTRLHENLSATTIKRIWGYLNEGVKPRRSTLDLLARFAGYRSYENLLNDEGEGQSNEIRSRHLSSRDLKEGQRVRLRWKPNRHCIVRYEGCGQFLVEAAENTKLQSGDTFCCHLIIEREPLYIDNLVHDGSAPACYVAGRKDGIMFDVLP